MSDIDFFTQNKAHYKSKKGSLYFYTDKGVYRKSNHWGRVANCRWKLIANNNNNNNNNNYKNQQTVIAFAKWTGFYPLNNIEKIFYISVDFISNHIEIHHIKNQNENDFFLFSLTDVLKRKKQIKHLLTTTQWSKYFEKEISTLRKKIINKLITTDKSLQEIKTEQD